MEINDWIGGQERVQLEEYLRCLSVQQRNGMWGNYEQIEITLHCGTYYSYIKHI